MVFTFSLIALSCTVPMNGATWVAPSVYTQAHISTGGRQIAKSHQGGVFFEKKHQKKEWGPRKGNFVRNGGIGKLAIGFLSLAFLLGTFGQLIFLSSWVTPVAILMVGLGLLLALSGVIVGGENETLSKSILLTFASLALIYGLGLLVVWLAIRNRDD
ncbi:MAG: hypothetical protein MUC59_01580 [Saprospiraceae bacterium]|nr:hypothetical protein [Saprospiraceae bacterium]